MTLRVSETFASLQGEGLFVGMPSFFIRLAGCNLACEWCDTLQARDPAAGTAMTIENVTARAAEAGVPHVVITGGEPTLQSEELTALCARLRAQGQTVTIETNATRFVPCRPHLWSLSPKFDAWDDDVLRQYAGDDVPLQVKLVPGDERDADELLARLAPLAIPARRIMLMPCARSRDEYLEQAAWLAPYCIKRSARFGPRLQTVVWNNAEQR